MISRLLSLKLYQYLDTSYYIRTSALQLCNQHPEHTFLYFWSQECHTKLWDHSLKLPPIPNSFCLLNNLLKVTQLFSQCSLCNYIRFYRNGISDIFQFLLSFPLFFSRYLQQRLWPRSKQWCSTFCMFSALILIEFVYNLVF